MARGFDSCGRGGGEGCAGGCGGGGVVVVVVDRGGRGERGDHGLEGGGGEALGCGFGGGGFLREHLVVELVGVHLDALFDFGRAVFVVGGEVAEGFEETLFFFFGGQHMFVLA